MYCLIERLTAIDSYTIFRQNFMIINLLKNVANIAFCVAFTSTYYHYQKEITSNETMYFKKIAFILNGTGQDSNIPTGF